MKQKLLLVILIHLWFLPLLAHENIKASPWTVSETRISQQVRMMLGSGADFGIAVKDLPMTGSGKQKLFSIYGKENNSIAMGFTLDHSESSIVMSSHELDAVAVPLNRTSQQKGNKSLILSFKRTSEDKDRQSGTRVTVFLGCSFEGSVSVPFDLFRDFDQSDLSFVSIGEVIDYEPSTSDWST